MSSNDTNITSSSYKDIFYDKNNNRSGITSVIVIVCLFSLLTGLIGYYIGDRNIKIGTNLLSFSSQKTNSSNANVYTDEEISKLIDSNAYNFNLYTQIIGNLKEKYVDPSKISDEKLFNGSLKGMVDSIGDKATSYFSPSEYQDYLGSFSGKFEGIGVRLEYSNNQVVVMDVMTGSPAEQAGVKVGYVFYKVDGKDVSTNTIEEVVSKVRGEKGTTVKITFVDPEKKEEVEKEITRAPISVESMRLIEKDEDTVIFEISRFTEDKLEIWNNLWDKNVEEINSKGYKNIVLDLRGNGGGYLDAAIHAANDFLDPGKLIVTEKSRTSSKDTLSQKAPRLKGKNVVILVNGGTASASEILAGAIKFHNGYKVYGTKTFGKGTVQSTYDLPNKGAIKITTEYWLLPTGKRLDNENPILPDVEIKQEQDKAKEGKDNVLDEAMKSFNQQ